MALRRLGPQPIRYSATMSSASPARTLSMTQVLVCGAAIRNNTALPPSFLVQAELVCWLLSLEDHALAKRAKDLGSAAVLLSLLLAGGLWTGALWQRFGGSGA